MPSRAMRKATTSISVPSASLRLVVDKRRQRDQMFEGAWWAPMRGRDQTHFRSRRAPAAVGAGAKVLVIIVVLALVFFFVPLVSVSGSANYVVASYSGTIYESLGLNLFHCGGYYLSESSSILGQGHASTSYGVVCNLQTSSGS